MTSLAKPTMSAILEPALQLPLNLAALAACYRGAQPYPHLVLDGMFSPLVLDALIAEMPNVTSRDWVSHDTKGLERKLGLRSALALHRTGFDLTALLHSAPFLSFITAVTGITELLPDPYLQGGGYSCIPPGGFFNVHVDRNVAYETGLLRRLAFIVYLNKAWQPEYGGQLELWNKDGTRREVVVEPAFNRAILFEVAEGNYHGVPTPVACPAGQSRNSFLVYYHTVPADGGPVPHSSIFAGRAGSLTPRTWRTYAKDWLPPIVFRTLKQAAGRHSER